MAYFRLDNQRRGMKATPLLREYIPTWVTDKLRMNKRSNDLTNAKKNISAHYDLGNDFFSCEVSMNELNLFIYFLKDIFGPRDERVFVRDFQIPIGYARRLTMGQD